MPAELPNAAPLLGQTFLDKFGYKIDSDQQKLVMSKVEAEGAAPKHRHRKDADKVVRVNRLACPSSGAVPIGLTKRRPTQYSPRSTITVSESKALSLASRERTSSNEMVESPSLVAQSMASTSSQ